MKNKSARQTLETAYAITARTRFFCTTAASAMTTIAKLTTRTTIMSGPAIGYHQPPAGKAVPVLRHKIRDPAPARENI